MRNVVELRLNDLTVRLLVDRIYMKNSCAEDNVREREVINRHWAQGHAEYCITGCAVQLQFISNRIFNAPPLQTSKLGFPKKAQNSNSGFEAKKLAPQGSAQCHSNCLTYSHSFTPNSPSEAPLPPLIPSILRVENSLCMPGNAMRFRVT